MSDSKRQQLVEAIEARLSTITEGQVFKLPDGDYICQNTIAGVYPWRKTPFSKNQVPAIEFWDSGAETAAGPAGQHKHDLQISLQILVADTAPASTARSLLADVVACIGSDPRWSKRAHWTELTGHGLVVERAGDVVAAAQIAFTIQYRTPLWRM